jgi:hypothetical protein
LAIINQESLAFSREVGRFYADPLGFVRWAYPWRVPGKALEHFDGPDEWQAEELRQLAAEVKSRRFDGVNAVRPIRLAIASGHGIGKSTWTAWITDWIMATRPHSQGTVTANTVTQLETKTWAAIQSWTKISLVGGAFRVTGNTMRHRLHPASWFCNAQTCKEENSEAFAGQHARTSTSFYIFDEASAIPDKIWEVAEGGLTDGEPMFFAFGNPTRSSGKFYRICFGNEQHRWRRRSIDSRTCSLTTEETRRQIKEWQDDYGEDSDFFRVRVRGIPPRAGELQFIDQERVNQAQKRAVETLADEPLVCGVDVSGGGAAWTVCAFRKGKDARSIPRIRLTGEQSRDRNVIVAKLADVLSDPRPDRRPAAMFIDSAFGAAIVERLRVLGHKNVIEVNFGGASSDPHQLNMRAYMWSRLKDWLLTGGIPGDTQLETQLTGPGYHINRQNQLVIESKQDMAKRGVASPDDGDALALTFAQRVAPPKPKKAPAPSPYPSTAWG